MKFAVGYKGKMTQVFTEDGKVVPVTAIYVEPAVVSQIRTDEKDGYRAVQLAFANTKEHRVAKPQREAYKDLGFFKYFKEFRVGEHSFQRGDKIDASVFQEGDIVQVSGISKGKGFQGVVKRHGFAGGPKSHGQKHTLRAPGSIGATGPQRVFKGKKMAGRMGGDRVTVKNLKVVKIDQDNGVLYISGAVPGRPGTIIEVVSKK